MKLYFAPINGLGHYVFRHFLLSKGADFVFSELILPSDIDRDEKFKVFPGDENKTIFQIGAGCVEDVELLVSKLPNAKEINLNMGCPHSSMQQRKICSGVLYDLDLMGKLCAKLSSYTFIPSVKLRLGTSPDKIRIKEYLDICSKNGVKKFYIHFRTLKWNYTKPVIDLENLSEDFPDLEIIYNGDIDCYDKCENYDSYMIGRAALSNPLIFKQIKNCEKGRVKQYDPYLNDSSIVLRGGKCYLSDEKRKVISEFVDLCNKEGISKEQIKRNLAWMYKGVSNKKASSEI